MYTKRHTCVHLCADSPLPVGRPEKSQKRVLLVEKVKNESKEPINGNWETGQAFSLVLLVGSGEKISG